MRRFLVTSPNFTGQVELLYNADGWLCGISWQDVNANTKLITSILDKATRAAHVDIVSIFINGTQATLIEADF